MATTRSKTPYSRIYSRIDSRDSTRTSDDSGAPVELKPLHNEVVGENQDHHTEDTRLKSRHSLIPWQGPIALLFVALLTAAAVGVLLASNGSPIERWRLQKVQIQPQVWLSVLSTLMNGLAFFALAKAAEFTFWRATARGTTLREMYDLYESQSLLGAVNNLVRLRGDKLAVVAMLCLVSALRGPLFQRASVVVSNATRTTSGLQTLGVAQLIPPNFMFYSMAGRLTPFDDVYNAYIERTPIYANFNGEECGDFCEGKVKVFSSMCDTGARTSKLTVSRAMGSTSNVLISPRSPGIAQLS